MMRKEIREKQTITKYNVYYAFDGKEFDSKDKCLAYEKKHNLADVSDIPSKHIHLINIYGGDRDTIGYYVTTKDQLERLTKYISSSYGVPYEETAWEFKGADWFIFTYDTSQDYPSYEYLTLSEITKEIQEFNAQFKVQEVKPIKTQKEHTVEFLNTPGRGCRHQIVVVGEEKDTDYHTSNAIHFGVCPMCKHNGNWEIRGLDYVVVSSQNKELKFPFYVDFDKLFEVDTPYTEREVVEKLVEVYQPRYIMNGVRCLYTQTKGIQEDKLWK